MEHAIKEAQEVSSASKNTIPVWAEALTSLGERFAALTADQSARRLTLALCLPCFDFAAAFLGIGILKVRLAASSAESQKDRMASLVGQWVSFEGKRKTNVGILEFCENKKRFMIKLEKHGLWTVLDEEDWGRVRPTGREFNPNRRLSHRQTEKITDQNRSISTFSDFFAFDRWGAALDNSGLIFSIYGNKSRMNQELSESLFPDDEASLGKIIRPEAHPDYGESFHCTLEASRASMPDDDAALVIIEAGRALPDQIAESRHLNRVVLLARNAADYDDCAAVMMEQSSLRITGDPALDIPLPGSIGVLPFYHR
jgi:hypothetical protein